MVQAKVDLGLVGDKDRARMSDLYPSLTQCAVVATAFKILLWPA